jgi:hypothetical protein
MKTKIHQLARRLTSNFDEKEAIVKWGDDNLYPQRMERIIDASQTAKSCTALVAKYIIGKGLAVKNEKIIGTKGSLRLTAEKLLRRVARDISRMNALAVHVNWNANYKISDIEVLPIQNVRLGKIDSKRYQSKIVYNEEWEKQKKGFDFKSSSKNHVFDVFNPDPKVIDYQVKNAGGWNKWNGQVFYYNFDEYSVYPLSSIDVVQDDADTESQIQIYKNKDLRNGFGADYIIFHEKFEDDDEAEMFTKEINEFKGANNKGSIMVQEANFTEIGDKLSTGFIIEKLEKNVNDKIWEHYEKSIANNIRKAVYNIPPLLIDLTEGKLGNTSGESILQAKTFLNEQTEDIRNTTSNVLWEFMQFFDGFSRDMLKIKPLIDETNSNTQ